MKNGNLRWIHIFKWFGISLITIVVLLLTVVIITRIIKANRYKIETKNGIQESTYIELGGIKQYIQIRGDDVNNPIIIFLHGGPGSPMAYVSYYYQTQLESDFTMVNWDQRGCGRTYYANPNMNMKTELSTDILLSDLNGLTDYLMKRFGQDKVIIMGHSWGSLLGITYIREHPEKVSAYIGIGQVTDDSDAIVLAANTAIEKATEKGNEKDVGKLSAALSRFTEEKNYDSLDARNYMSMVGLEQKYLTYNHKMSTLQQIWLGLSSPYISLNDIRWFLALNNIEKTFKLEAPLMGDVFYKSDITKQGKEFQVPMYFISGESDWTTPRVMVEEYFKSVQAPDKEMIVIKDAGHSPFIDNPNAFCKAVKRVLSNKSSKK